MDKYAIYSYELTEKPRRNEVELPEMPSIEKMSPEGRFKSLFGTKRGDELPLQKSKKHGTVDKYNGRVLRHLKDIVLLRVENKKKVELWVEQPSNNPIPNIEKTKKESIPYCYVIIDNRPNAHLIAIQSGTAAWGDTKRPERLVAGEPQLGFGCQELWSGGEPLDQDDAFYVLGLCGLSSEDGKSLYQKYDLLVYQLQASPRHRYKKRSVEGMATFREFHEHD